MTGCCSVEDRRVSLKYGRGEVQLDLSDAASVRWLYGSDMPAIDDLPSAFLSAVEHLYRLNIRCGKNSAYKKDGAYFLIFDYPSVPKKLKLLLSEFGQWQSGKFSAARVREFAEPICERNAVEIIGRRLV